MAPTGEIDIDNAPAYDPDQFNARVGITFPLAGGCTLSDGSVVPVSSAPDLSGDQGAMVLMNVEQNGNPSGTAHSDVVEAKWVPGNRIPIEVDDKNEAKTYYFRPGVVVPAPGNYFISVDSPLVNRRDGGHN